MNEKPTQPPRCQTHIIRTTLFIDLRYSGYRLFVNRKDERITEERINLTGQNTSLRQRLTQSEDNDYRVPLARSLVHSGSVPDGASIRSLTWTFCCGR